MNPLCHLSTYKGDVFTRLKLVCIKNRNIPKKKKSKFGRPFDGDNSQFICQECRKVQIIERIFLERLPRKSFRIIRIFDFQRFESRKGNYKCFLRKFYGGFKLVRIMEIFELRRFELERVNCMFNVNN